MCTNVDNLSERLRRYTRNLLGFSRTDLNPVVVESVHEFSFQPRDGQPPPLFTGDIEWTATCRSCHIGGAHTFMACGCFIYTIEENSFFFGGVFGGSSEISSNCCNFRYSYGHVM